MMRNVTSLRGYAVRATDGVIGKVDDILTVGHALLALPL